jgi:hypothetical protein
MNPKLGNPIENDRFPVIGDGGYLIWNKPLELISSIPCLNTTALGLLNSVQPGLSSLSTNFTRGFNSMLNGMIAKLRETYVPSVFLIKKYNDLSTENGFIKNTDIYACASYLSRLDRITESIVPMILFLQTCDSNFPNSGYVSTINPGQYRNYYSTLGFTGGTANTITGKEGLRLDLGGFQILDSSKLRLDINANVNVTYTNPPTPQSIVTTFSTFLYNGTRPIGTPVVVNYSNLNFTMSKFTYFLTAADLSVKSIGLWHRITNFDNTSATIDVMPISVDVRLVNMD